MGWMDHLQIGGLMRYAPQLTPPNESLEQFGELMKVDLITNGQFAAEIGTYGGACCPYRLQAKLSADEQTLNVSAAHYVPMLVGWKRQPGNSCIHP